MRYISRAKWIILVASVAAGVGAYFYSRTLPDYYKATINCVPATSDQGLLGGSGGLGGALKDIGLSKLGQSGGPSYEFIVIMESRQIRDSMIRSFDLIKDYGLESKPLKDVREEFEANLDLRQKAEGNYEITIWSKDPQQSVKMCEAFVRYVNQVANDVQRKDAHKTTLYLTNRVHAIDSLLGVLSTSLGKFSKEYLMFDPEAQATASAKAITEARATLLQQQTMLQLLENSYGPKDPQVVAQSAVVKNLEQQYQDLTNKPGFVGDFSLRDAAGIGAGYMRLLTEFEAHSKLKAFLLPTLEQARIDQQKSTPSLLIVDDPVQAEKKDRPKRSLIAGGTALGTAILIVTLMLLWRAWRDTFSKQSKS